MDHQEFEIYKGKKFTSLLKDIVVNSEDRNRTIEKLIDDLRAMVKTPQDAILIIPLIKEYLDVTIRNDEQLIKLAAIVQRIMNNSPKDENGGFILSEEDKKKISEELDSIKKESISVISNVGNK